jgi:CheY-like chemotaxis protein
VSERDHLAAELAGARAAHERLEQTLAQTLGESRNREDAMAAQLAELERTLETLRAERSAAATKPARETRATPNADGGIATPAVEQSARPAARPMPLRSPAATVPPAEPTSDLVALLDERDAWSGVTVEPEPMILVSDDAGVGRLASARPGIVVVNLAASGAMRALVAARALGIRTRLCGYLAKPGCDDTLPLGAVEPAERPVAPDAIVAALTPRMPAKARVVTVGADVDAMLSLRQALGRQGASVSLAWDAKQATDLLDMVHPHVVVIDLEMARDACIVVARLAASQPAPIVVLIEGAASAGVELATVLGNPEIAAQLVRRKDLLRAVLGRAGSAPPKAAKPVGAAPPRRAAR